MFPFVKEKVVRSSLARTNSMTSFFHKESSVGTLGLFGVHASGCVWCGKWRKAGPYLASAADTLFMSCPARAGPKADKLPNPSPFEFSE